MPLQILKSVDIVYLYFVTVYDPIDVKVWLLTAFSAWEIQWVVAGNKHSFIHSETFARQPLGILDQT